VVGKVVFADVPDAGLLVQVRDGVVGAEDGGFGARELGAGGNDLGGFRLIDVDGKPDEVAVLVGLREEEGERGASTPVPLRSLAYLPLVVAG
jgi:hypothetical protein